MSLFVAIVKAVVGLAFAYPIPCLLVIAPVAALMLAVALLNLVAEAPSAIVRWSQRITLEARIRRLKREIDEENRQFFAPDWNPRPRRAKRSA
jgi:hypothetical protein